jgi:hypothetical protein
MVCSTLKLGVPAKHRLCIAPPPLPSSPRLLHRRPPPDAMTFHLPGGIICLDCSDSSIGSDVEEIVKWDDRLRWHRHRDPSPRPQQPRERHGHVTSLAVCSHARRLGIASSLLRKNQPVEGHHAPCASGLLRPSFGSSTNTFMSATAPVWLDCKCASATRQPSGCTAPRATASRTSCLCTTATESELRFFLPQPASHPRRAMNFPPLC